MDTARGTPTLGRRPSRQVLPTQFAPQDTFQEQVMVLREEVTDKPSEREGDC